MAASLVITVAILEGLLSPDPALRSASEDALSVLSPEQKCQELLRVLPAVAAHAETQQQHDAAAGSAVAASFANAAAEVRRDRLAKVIGEVGGLAETRDPIAERFLWSVSAAQLTWRWSWTG